MGALDGFPISDQFDYVNAAGEQSLKSAWTSFSYQLDFERSSWVASCPKELLLQNPASPVICSFGFRTLLYHHYFYSITITITLCKRDVTFLFFFLHMFLTKQIVRLPLSALHRPPQGSRVVRQADLWLESRGFDASFHQQQRFFFFLWGGGGRHWAPTCSVQIRASAKCQNAVQKCWECVALLDGLREHHKANPGNWHHHAAGSLPWENLSANWWSLCPKLTL